jgi:hypothetical protein
MDEMEQQEAFWKGTHVADRKDEEHNIFLYQFDNFYVEVFYHREYNVVRRYWPFKNPELLAPYLEQIDISGLK